MDERPQQPWPGVAVIVRLDCDVALPQTLDRARRFGSAVGSGADIALALRPVSQDVLRPGDMTMLAQAIHARSMRLIFEVALGHESVSADAMRGWLAQGVDGFAGSAMSAEGAPWQPGAATLCADLGRSETGDDLAHAYLDLPGLSRYYRPCERHPAHAIRSLDLNLVSSPGSAARELVDSFEHALSPDDMASYRWSSAAREPAHDNMRRAKIMLALTLRGLPVVDNFWDLGEDTVVKITSKYGDQVRPHLMSDLYAAAGAADPESELSLMRHLIHLRRTCPALTSGEYHSIDTRADEVFGFVREVEKQRMLGLVNFSTREVDVHVAGPVGAWICGTHLVHGDGRPPAAGVVTLRGFEGRLYEYRGGKS